MKGNLVKERKRNYKEAKGLLAKTTKKLLYQSNGLTFRWPCHPTAMLNPIAFTQSHSILVYIGSYTMLITI